MSDKDYKIVVLGLGSNIGDRNANLQLAISEISEILYDVKLSSVMETEALLPALAPQSWNMPYLNMAVIGGCRMSARELLNTIKSIEEKIGRKKIGHWSPRVIDIDILAMLSEDGKNIVVDEPDLVVPHPHVLCRDFALAPMLELLPSWVSPAIDGLVTSKKSKGATLVGIVNVTPDSFSDAGNNFSPDCALTSIKELIKQGARVIDIGAESTRPNAIAITPEEEWRRLAPLLEHIMPNRELFPAEISIDTRHPKTAQNAIKYGVDWINDVSGFIDKEMIDAVANSKCRVVVMHSLTVPADKAVTMPDDCDVVAEIINWGEKRIYELQQAGIDKNRIIFDVGVGFGKTAKQSQILIERITEFHRIGVPLLVGHSRKSFIGAKTIDEADCKTVAISRMLAVRGVDYLRVHNVAAHLEISQIRHN